MNDVKKWWLSKTLWLALIQGVAGIVTVLATDFPSLGWVAVAKSFVDVVLRLITVKAVI